MANTYSIAIAGAGIGGLTAAAALAQAGHRVQIYDAFDRPRPVGSGLVIQPAGQDALASIGALQMAVAHGARIWRMQGVEATSGRSVLDVRYGPLGGETFGLAIQRPSLFEAVLTAATEAGTTLIPAHRVRAVEGRHLFFSDGTSDGPFDLIIDASGVKSPLSPLQGKPLPYGALWASVPWPGDSSLPKDQLSQRYRRANRMVGVMPSGTIPGASAETATIFWSLPSNGYDIWRENGISHWQQNIRDLWPEAAPFFASIVEPDQMTFASYTHGTLRETANGRLVHIGDAAHRASPQLGQGANMAMLDAWALAEALKRWPLEEALAQYARARRVHVALYQAMSRAFTPQYQSDSRILPVLRDRALAPLSLVPPIPAILTRLVCGTLVPPLASLTPSSK